MRTWFQQPCGSVLDQQDVNLELVVIDDGSDDHVDTALGPYLSHAALHFLRIEHAGVTVARNKGLAASSGDVIAYLDSDNLMCQDYLIILIAAYAASPDAHCAFAAMLWDDREYYVHLRHDLFDWQDLFANKINLDMNCFSHRRELWQELGGFDDSLTKHSDYDLALRYTKAHEPLRINAVAAHYNNTRALSRLSYTQPSLPNYMQIRSKHHAMSAAPLRVLIYCYDYPQLSGSYVDTEIRWFSRQGVEIEVFAVEASGAPGKATVPVHRRNFEQMVCTFRPDVIHCYWLPLSEGVVSLANDLNISATVRGHGFEFSAENLMRCGAQQAVKSIYLFPHFLVPPFEAHPKARAVPACFNSNRFYPRIWRDRYLVLCAGACLDTKDVDLFIRVAAECPEYRFVLALADMATLPNLPDEFCGLNESLGSPVAIRFNVPYEEMAALTAEAGVCLHTFGFDQRFGMPVSLAESLACGAVTLVRDCAEAQAYAGPALYFNTREEAAALLKAMLDWPDEEWNLRSARNADFAYAHYADEVVLQPILDDWRQLAGLNGQSHGASAR